MGSVGFAGDAGQVSGLPAWARHVCASRSTTLECRTGVRASRSSPWKRVAWLTLLTVTAAGSAMPAAHAQTTVSAADKATARNTATEGIELYREQKYAEALDRMQRAQQLFQAPVHLLYIARCQRELGQWVEAAETYRALVKTQLESGAPDAFVKAQSDGKSELEELQPRIPRLLVEITPADAPELQLELDGKPLSSAVVGIERPLNPGRRDLTVRATGYVEQQRPVEATEGELVQVAITLEPEPVSPQPVEAVTAQPSEPSGPPPRHRTFLDTVALLLSLRLGAAFPAGQAPGALVNTEREEPVRVREFAGTGTELELHVGSHFLDRWGISAFLGIKSFAAKNVDYAEGTLLHTTGKPSMATLGISVLGGSRRGRFGGFGELSLGVLHGFAVPSERTSRGLVPINASCSVTATTSGLTGRLGAGLNVPLYARAIHLTPYIALEAGRATSIEYKGCSTELRPAAMDTNQTHTTLSLGVGGDFFIGGVP